MLSQYPKTNELLIHSTLSPSLAFIKQIYYPTQSSFKSRLNLNYCPVHLSIKPVVGLGSSLWAPSKPNYSMISRQHNCFTQASCRSHLHTASLSPLRAGKIQFCRTSVGVLQPPSLCHSWNQSWAPFDKGGLEWHHRNNFLNFQDINLHCLLVLSCLPFPEVYTFCKTNL